MKTKNSNNGSSSLFRILYEIIRTRNARRNEFSRESANDWYTRANYTTLRGDTIRWTHPSPAEQNDWSWMRDISSHRKTVVLVDQEKKSSPSGEEEEGFRPSPALRPPTAARPRHRPRYRRRARQRRDDVPGGRAAERRKRSGGGGYHRLLAAAGAVIGRPWKGERRLVSEAHARTRECCRYASFDRWCRGRSTI